MNTKKAPELSVIAEPYPDGQRISKAVFSFDGDPCDPSGITVKGRTIIGSSVDGSTVTLELSPSDEEAKVLPDLKRPGSGPGGTGGPGGPGGSGGPGSGPRPPMPDRKLRDIWLEAAVPGWDGPILPTKVVQPVIDDFTQGQFRGLLYNLYVPKDYDPSKKYPIVMFIPDAGVNGNDAKLALSQGIGATIWATPEEQAKHPCFVLALQIPKGIHLTNDEFVASPELEDIKDLLDKTADEYSIDKNRIYTTGQSQGCMASCELNIRYPDYFAASMLVSGQWDPQKMGKLINNKFIIGLSEGGPKEFPGMNAITEALRENGADITRVRLDYRDRWDVNNEKVRTAAMVGSNVIYISFLKDSVFPDDGVERSLGAHHNRGWELTYDMEAARDWLFAQSKE